MGRDARGSTASIICSPAPRRRPSRRLEGSSTQVYHLRRAIHHRAVPLNPLLLDQRGLAAPIRGEDGCCRGPKVAEDVRRPVGAAEHVLNFKSRWQTGGWRECMWQTAVHTEAKVERTSSCGRPREARTRPHQKDPSSSSRAGQSASRLGTARAGTNAPSRRRSSHSARVP